MSETAHHLVENIIPKVPVRQYVLSIPYPLRYWLASNKELTGKVHKILARTVEEFYCDPNNKKTRSGAITFIQRHGPIKASDLIDQAISIELMQKDYLIHFAQCKMG